ncbi:MAG TPA: EMC3/TMCO1 family protein [Candidatus Nanoarchaeia archaeon]|nr:EMC3/TMCO1 family protein [Candidatus Nanoarchaeia archaeon]
MAIVEILQQNALLSIIGISAALALGSTLVYKFATDQALVKAIREEVKKIQVEMKENKGNPQKLAELQNKVMPLNLKLMSQSFRPMLITIVPFIILFALLGRVYGTMIVVPLSFWEGHLGWIGTYIIFSIIFTTLLRKALKVV